MASTPIFDLEKPLPPLRTRRWIGLLIGIPIGLSIGLITDHLPSFNGFLFLPALFAAIAIHELGHLLAGTIVGMPPGALVVCGFVIFKSGQRWRVRFEPRYILGGFAKVLPSKDEFRRTPFAWMIAGGPIASVLLTAVSGFELAQHGSGTGAWIGTLLWAAVLTDISSLFPLSIGSSRSDGARLLIMVRHPEEFGPWQALMALQTEETRGVVPREWDATLVTRMLEADPSSREYPYIQLLAFYRRIDEKRVELALEHLENVLARSARSGKQFRQCVFLEAAASSGFNCENSAQARTWLKRAGKLREPLSADAAEAGIAFSEERHDDSLRYLANARNRIDKRKLDSGLARFAREQITECELMCERAKEEHQSSLRP